MSVVFLGIIIFCYGVFTTSSLFILYLFYESSLIPILYVILKWGSYPERSVSSVILLIYTSIFTFPFISVLFIFYNISGGFSLTDSALIDFVGLDSLRRIVIFVTFAVKLPIYGLHF